MRIILKKYKYPFIIFIFLATIYTVAVSWHAGTLKGAREFYPLEKSENRAASEAFIEAQVYMAHIEKLHAYFDYDSIVMKPFMSRMNEAFERGKSLLPEDSIEDILWWVFTYRHMYGLVVPPRNDNSIAYDRLPPDAFAKVHDKVYEMIKRFPKGKLTFPTERFVKYRFQAYQTLVDFYSGQYSLRYNPKDGDTLKQFRMDNKASQRLKKILKEYSVVKQKYLKDVGKGSERYQQELYDFELDMVYVALDVIFHEVALNNKKLPKEMCTSKEADIIMKYSEALLPIAKKDKKIFKNIFDEKHTATLAGLGHLVVSCPTIALKARKIYDKIDELNKKIYRGKDE